MKTRRFDIGLDFVLLLALCYLIDTQNLFFLALFAAAMHEMGHVLAIWLCGAYIDRVELRATGANIVLAPYPMLSYWQELFVAAAGPAAGLLAVWCFGLWQNETCALLAGFSLLLSLFNLLPAAPLDGGRMLHACVMQAGGGAWICTAGNIAAACALAALCIAVCALAGISPGLCAFCAFAMWSFFQKSSA